MQNLLFAAIFFHMKNSDFEFWRFVILGAFFALSVAWEKFMVWLTGFSSERRSTSGGDGGGFIGGSDGDCGGDGGDCD